MSELTNYNQFKDLNVCDVIYHVNPYGYGHRIQHMVKIKQITVLRIDSKGRVIDANGEKFGFISDMLRGVKKTFNCLSDAEEFLADVHNGNFADSVSDHHYSCARW